MGKPRVSVIIPTMNEEESIGEVIDSIPRDFAEVEVMIVDTNSKDRTCDIAREKGAIVVSEPRRGYGRAYKTGFEKAAGDIIVTLDGDTTYPAEEIPSLVRMLLQDDLDFITCDRLTKMKEGAMNFQHRIGNWLITFAANTLFGIRLTDSQSGMWVFKKEILSKIHPRDDGMPFSEEIKIEAFTGGLHVKEVPVEYRPRKGEVKLNTWRDGRKNLLFILFKKLAPVE